MASPSSSSRHSIARRALGVLLVCGGLVLVGIAALFGVAAIVRPSERSDTRSEANSDGEVRRTTRSARSEAKIPANATTHARNVEHLTDTTLAADFVVAAGETYDQAGARLTEVGKDLCLLPGVETAILNVVGPDNARLGQVTLPLNSFLGLHEGDAAKRAMSAAIWRTNAPLLLQQAIGKQ
jgi:hypothetical protein